MLRNSPQFTTIIQYTEFVHAINQLLTFFANMVGGVA